MRTKFILTHFGSTFGTLRFDEKSFFKSLSSFKPYWDYKPTNAISADSPVVYTIDEILNSSTVKKVHLKCDCVDGSVVKGIRHVTLYFLVLF